MPTREERLAEARRLLTEQTLTPANREAAEEALDAIAAELTKADADEEHIAEQIGVLNVTAYAVAEYMMTDTAQLDPTAADLPTPPLEQARLTLRELEMVPVNREGAEEALEALEAELTKDAPDDAVVREQLALLKVLAVQVYESLFDR